MLPAFDGQTGEELNAADVDPDAPPVGHRDAGDERPHDPREVEFRAWSAGDRVVCTGCRAAVSFRRGRERAAHFAHRADTDCRHARATSAEHAAAQTALYRWLRGKCGRGDGPLGYAAVRADQWPEGGWARRPVDCRVEDGPGEVRFDVLLLDRLLRLDERDGWDGHARSVGPLQRVGVGRRFSLWRGGARLDDGEYPGPGERVTARLGPQGRWAAGPSRHAAPPHLSPAEAARAMEGGAGGAPVGSAAHFLVAAADPPRPSPEAWGRRKHSGSRPAPTATRAGRRSCSTRGSATPCSTCATAASSTPASTSGSRPGAARSASPRAGLATRRRVEAAALREQQRRDGERAAAHRAWLEAETRRRHAAWLHTERSRRERVQAIRRAQVEGRPLPPAAAGTPPAPPPAAGRGSAGA